LIPLYNIIQINYPTAIIGLNGNVQLADHGDGLGAVIQLWDIPGVDQPTDEQLTALQNDANTIATYQAHLNTHLNQPILDKLDELDRKSIRPIRENDVALLASLTTQAVALRAQLLPMTAAGVIAAKGS
jgi:hypothetical protein